MRMMKQYYWIIGAILSFFFAWNSQSFWIDECCTALCGTQDSLSGVWAQVNEIGGSDAQIAFYYFLLYIWTSITHCDSELMYRLFNLIWVVLAAWFFRKEPKALILLLISPFFIYYANELRPYILQIAASCGVTMFLYRKSMGEEQSFSKGFALFFFLCLTSLSSVVWSLGFLLAWMVLEGKDFWSRYLVRALCYWGVPFIGLAAYYIYTLMIGARAVTIQSNWIVNIGASFYELLGLTGIGPNRSELRLCTTLDSLLGNYELIVSGLCGVVILTLLICGIKEWSQKTNAPIVLSLVMLVVPMAVFAYAAWMMDFRFSGRHWAPLLPIVIIILSQAFIFAKNKPRLSCLSIMMLLVWLVSDCRMRFDDTYAREDFRGAITYCKQEHEKGNTVLLLCNGAGKEYYQWQDIVAPEDWITCQRIVVTRPDDYSKLIGQIESSNLFQKRKLCPAFWVYELSK